MQLTALREPCSLVYFLQMRSYEKSRLWYERALMSIPGGVNSPVRAFRSVGRSPLFIDHGERSHIIDVDGNSYVDYVMSYGPLLFGHAPESVITAIERTARNGTSFGASTPREVEFSERISGLIPSIQKLRLVSSGTEAVMSAVRIARGFTGRDKILKFEGNYHGHSDGLLSSAGSGVATYDLPGSAGVPQNLTRDTVTVPYNDIDAVVSALDAHPNEFAALLVEPVAANMGVVPPKAGFLAALREETIRRDILLIFDEIITGFRLSAGGAQGLFGIWPDITCLGKIIGGGLPLAAYGGRSDVLDSVAPVGPVYQAGTLSGNPLAVAAGIEVLNLIEAKPNLYVELDRKMTRLAESAKESANRHRVPYTINRVGSILTLFFTPHDVTNYQLAKTSNTDHYAKYFNKMLDAGVYLAPSQFEAAFVSYAHTEDDFLFTADAVEFAFSRLNDS
jgi:glutamate-1-semialdehyde 2,1-aminomutase